MRIGRLGGLLAALASMLSSSTMALANGRFPAAGQIVVHPTDEARIVVRATYGILLSSTGGEPWSFLCEQAVGYGGYQDPPLVFTADGSLLAAVVDGLSASHDGACTWTFPPGPDGKYVFDISGEPRAPEKVIGVLTTNASGADSVSQLWSSSDNGRTWAQEGVDMPAEFLALNVDVAPSTPNRIYTSGRFGPPDYPGALLRSDDRGATWQRFDIPGSSAERLPYLSAVDPLDPDVVYVRLDGDPTDTLVVSRDGGMTWDIVFEGIGALLAFAASPDGTRVAIGGEKDGVWVAPSDGLQFEKRSEVGARCFLWTDKGLYACADEFRDAFTAGLSTDEGASFTPLMHLQRLCGPLACPAGTPTGELCPPQWGKVKLTLKTEPCASEASASSAGAETPPSDPGCDCRVMDGEPDRSDKRALGAVLAAMALAVARRRRRHPSCTTRERVAYRPAARRALQSRETGETRTP